MIKRDREKERGYAIENVRMTKTATIAEAVATAAAAILSKQIRFTYIHKT